MHTYILIYTHAYIYVGIERLCIKESYKFPDFFKNENAFSIKIGENMSGEIGTVYLFSEAVPNDILTVIKTLSVAKTAGKWSQEYISDLDIIASKGNF